MADPPVAPSALPAVTPAPETPRPPATSLTPRKSRGQTIGESAVDITGIAAVTLLAYVGKVDGNLALLLVLLLAGVRVADLIAVARSGGPGAGGVAGLLVAFAVRLLHLGGPHA